MDPSKPSLVPENVLKKKHSLDLLAQKKASNEASRGNRANYSSKKKASPKYRNPEKFIAEARGKKNSATRFNRVKKKGLQSKAKKATTVKSRVVGTIAPIDSIDSSTDGQEIHEHYNTNSLTSPFVFVIRIRDDSAVSKVVRTTLTSLRLRNVNEGVFIRYNDANRKMLEQIDPYIVYGMVSKKIVKELINRRGFGKVDGERVPLTSNLVIEEAIGDATGVICVEDMVEEIMGVGDAFSEVVTFLWPFRLIAPKSGFEKRTLKVEARKEDYGDKGGLIDDVVQSMM